MKITSSPGSTTTVSAAARPPWAPRVSTMSSAPKLSPSSLLKPSAAAASAARWGILYPNQSLSFGSAQRCRVRTYCGIASSWGLPAMKLDAAGSAAWRPISGSIIAARNPRIDSMIPLRWRATSSDISSDTLAVSALVVFGASGDAHGKS